MSTTLVLRMIITLRHAQQRRHSMLSTRVCLMRNMLSVASAFLAAASPALVRFVYDTLSFSRRSHAARHDRSLTAVSDKITERNVRADAARPAMPALLSLLLRSRLTSH